MLGGGQPRTCHTEQADGGKHGNGFGGGKGPPLQADAVWLEYLLRQRAHGAHQQGTEQQAGRARKQALESCLMRPWPTMNA